MAPQVERSEPYKPKAWLWPKIRKGAGTQLRRLGPPGVLLLDSLRTARWLARLAKRKLAIALSPALREITRLGIDIDQVFWVNPAAIQHCARHEFSLQEFKGRVMDGDWDLAIKNFEDLDIYVAMKQVCVDGAGWKNTDFYRRFLDRVGDGEALWGCRNPDEIEQRLSDVQALFESIQEDGYKSREQIRAKQRAGPRTEDDEVAVCIGRHGDLLFSDGAHRLVAAKLLGVPRIPVQVSVRHTGWIAFRKELLLYAQHLGGRLHEPAFHPDLESVPALQGCDDLFRAIRDQLSIRRGHILVIGANIGYFCHRFENEGFTCYAAESRPRELYFLKKLRAIGKKKFVVFDEPVLSCQKVREINFDVVLALDGFHHLLDTQESLDLLVDMLSHLHTEQIFFQSHPPEEPQMRDAYRNVGIGESVPLIQKHTGLEHCQLIGAFLEGRKVYHLSNRAQALEIAF